MKPKKTGILLIALLCTASTFAQCWVTPKYQTTVSLPLTDITNKSFSGSVDFSGAGTITSSTNFNNWTALGLDGAINVQQTLNLNSSTEKIYINGSSILSNISMSGGDTIFANGAIIINAINSNNSNPGQHNVIMLGDKSSLQIGNKSYNVGDTVKLTGNPSNNIYIVGCSSSTPTSPTTPSSTLPITLKSFSFNGSALNWSFANNSDVAGVTVQGSNDGNNWSDIQQLSSSTTSFSIGGAATTASLVFLAPLLLLAFIGRIRNNVTKVFSLLFISTLCFFSCSKNDAVTNSSKTTSYEMYRLKITNNDGNIAYSNVVSK